MGKRKLSFAFRQSIKIKTENKVAERISLVKRESPRHRGPVRILKILLKSRVNIFIVSHLSVSSACSQAEGWADFRSLGNSASLPECRPQSVFRIPRAGSGESCPGRLPTPKADKSPMFGNFILTNHINRIISVRKRGRRQEAK